MEDAAFDNAVRTETASVSTEDLQGRKDVVATGYAAGSDAQASQSGNPSQEVLLSLEQVLDIISLAGGLSGKHGALERITDEVDFSREGLDRLASNLGIPQKYVDEALHRVYLTPQEQLADIQANAATMRYDALFDTYQKTLLGELQDAFPGRQFEARVDYYKVYYYADSESHYPKYRAEFAIDSVVKKSGLRKKKKLVPLLQIFFSFHAMTTTEYGSCNYNPCQRIGNPVDLLATFHDPVALRELKPVLDRLKETYGSRIHSQTIETTYALDLS